MLFHKDQSNINGVSRRKFLKRGGFLSGAAALAGIFSLTPIVAHAVPTAESSPQIVTLTGPEALRYIRMALASAEYKSFQKQQSSLLEQGFTLHETEATATLITTTTEKMVFVRIPIAGGAGHSFYGVAFQHGSSRITDTLAGLFTTLPDHNIAAQIWRNGKEIVNVVMTPDGKQFVQGYTIQINGQRQLLNDAGIIHPSVSIPCWMGALNSCLTNMGVSAWAIGLIGVICGVACAATVGVGCIVCLYSIVAISGGTMGYCVGAANKANC